MIVGRAVEMTEISSAERMDVMLNAANIAQNRQPCCEACASTAAGAMLVAIVAGSEVKVPRLFRPGKGARPVPYYWAKSCAVGYTADQKSGGYWWAAQIFGRPTVNLSSASGNRQHIGPLHEQLHDFEVSAQTVLP